VNSDSPVSIAVYEASDNMPLGKVVSWEQGHVCGSCKRTVETALARTILSAYYGSWEHIDVDAESAKRWLCLPCGAVLRDKDLRRRPITITKRGEMSMPTYQELRDALRDRIPADVAITLPIEGRKAVLAAATWGTLSTDAGSIQWTRAHRRALASIEELGALGFTEGLLSYPSPPFGVLAKIAPDRHQRVRELWQSLAAWRSDVASWPALVRLSRQDKVAA
jgi:hypothetical protein